MENAVQSNLILSSLFPPIVRDRLFGKVGIVGSGNKRYLATPKNRLRDYLDEGVARSSDNQKPIADLFPYTTIMFADISGYV